MQEDDRKKLLVALESSLDSSQWGVEREGDTWRLVSKSDDRTVVLPVHELDEQIAKTENQEEMETIIRTFVSRVTQAIPATQYATHLREQRTRLFPVIRSASFETGKAPGKRLIKSEHTAETTVLYALDFGESYVLVNEDMVANSQTTVDEVHRWAIQNLKLLSNEPKLDYVGDNRFYFFSQDIYAASRILNDKLLSDMKQKMQGEMAVAIPHQGVFIIADLYNNAGYNVLGQMAMKFYGEGQIPITPLPIVVEENRELTPILVMPDTIKQKRTFKK